MAAKLSNDELAERVRNRVKRNCAKYRERLARSGRTQTLVWLPDTIRAQLDGLVEARNLSLSAVTTELLSVALTTTPNQTTTTNRNASNDSPGDLFPRLESESAPVLTQADRIQRILELHRQGLSNYAVAEKMECSEATIRRALKRLNNEVTV